MLTSLITICLIYVIGVIIYLVYGRYTYIKYTITYEWATKELKKEARSVIIYLAIRWPREFCRMITRA